MEKENAEKSLLHAKLVLRLKPRSSILYNQIGNLYFDQQQWGTALAYYQKALKLKPDFSEACKNIARVYLFKNQLAKVQDFFSKSYELEHPRPFINVDVKAEIMTTPHKILHDLEQLRFLLQKQLIPSDYEKYIRNYQEVYEQIKHLPELPVSLEMELSKKIAPLYGKNIYFKSLSKEFETGLNPQTDFARVQADYLKNKPQFTWFDHFLNREVINELYEFCLYSTIWHDYKKTGGYVGSYLDNGFNYPLIYQLVEELKEKMPLIFEDLTLIHTWAYKYDSHLKGIPPHADEAMVNLNFWVTPNTANLDTDKGGLILYDIEAPQDWDFKDYNARSESICQFLAEKQAKKITVPYQQNRAIIFKSTIFHETDRFNFKPEYENRRINITMLFGEKK